MPSHRTHLIKIAGWVLFFCLISSFAFAAAPKVGTITPSSGTSAPDQEVTFIATYTDPDGWQNLSYAMLIVNTSATGKKGLYGYYNQNVNKLYLRNDANTAWLGGYAPGSNYTIENSYVKLNCLSTTVSGAATTLTVKWAITFKPAFSGKTYNTYLYALDDSGSYTGWIKKGSWIVNTPPQATSLTPSSGTFNVNTPYTFTTVVSDPDGYLNIYNCHFMINTQTANGLRCFYGYYARAANKLYLMTDTGTWGTGFAPGSANTIQNSYATLNCQNSSVTYSGNNLTVNWNLTFKTPFTGSKNSYLYVLDNTYAPSGWKQLGTATIPNNPPQAVSITPSSGTFNVNTPYTFTTVVSDPDGYLNINYCQFMVNTQTADGLRCFYGYYNRVENKLYLMTDTGTWGTGFAPGSANTIQNSYATLNCQNSSVTYSGNNLTVNWNLTFKTPFTGSKNSYLIVGDNTWATSGWKQLGTVTISSDTTPPAPPTGLSAVLNEDETIINITWTRNCETDLAGYKIYYGNSTQTYTHSVIIGNPNTTSYQLPVTNVNASVGSLYISNINDSKSPNGEITGNKSNVVTTEYKPDEIIIKFKPEVLHLDRSATILTIDEGMIPSSIVKLNIKSGVVKMERMFEKVIDTSGLSLQNIYKIRLKKGNDIERVLEEYKKNPAIEYAEPNYIFHATASLASKCYIALSAYDLAGNESNKSPEINVTLPPNDTYYKTQGTWGQPYRDMWGLHKIDATKAWGIETGNSNIVIAVVDTGCDYNHEDLSENIWINADEIPNNGIDDDNNGYVDDVRGWDFVDTYQGTPGEDTTVRDNDPMDHHGHGTHVAGIIDAATHNEVGIAGVCWVCKVMPVRAGFKTSWGAGLFESDDSAAAIIYAADNNSKVINISWGGSSDSNLIKNVIDYAFNKGAVIVAAAGNDGTNQLFYPAGYDNVIAVSATDYNDKKATFSNFGPWINVAAPGVDILSLRASGTDMYGDGSHIVGEKYYLASGTSMAAPHVAGLVGLVISKHFEFMNTQLIQVIRNSTDNIGNAEWNEIFGYGRINMLKALQINQIPSVFLNSPRQNEFIRENKIITGTILGDINYWTLFYKPPDPLINWFQLTNGFSGNVNYVFDTSTLSDGEYYLKLEAIDSEGNKGKDIVKVIIDNVYITSPKKDEIVKGIINIIGRASGTNFSSYKIEYGSGTNPINWCRLINSTVPVVNDVLVLNWDTSLILDGLYTLKLTVEYTDGHISEDKITIYIANNTLPSQPGWPVKLFIVDGTISSANSADLDNDGKKEVVVGFASTGDNLFVIKSDGTMMNGWPKKCGTFIAASPSIGDIDKDGDLEIVVGIEADNKVGAWHHNGSPVSGWPVNVGGSPYATAAITDIDKNYPGLEVVLGCKDGKVYAWHCDGTVVPGWPVDTGDFLISSPAVGDIDNDGDLEIVVGTYYSSKMYCWHHDGTPVNGWPRQGGNDGITSSPALADINKDGNLEVIIGAGDGYLYIWNYYGNLMPGWPQYTSGRIKESSPAIGDIDGDGDLEIVIGSNGNNGSIYAWHHNGSIVNGWPFDTYGIVGESSPVLADIDRNGDIEIVISSGGGGIPPGCTDDRRLYAIHHNGILVDNWPIYMERPMLATPLLDDIDADGNIEIIIGLDNAYVYAFKNPRKNNYLDFEWPMFHCNPQHTGRYSSKD
jgi:subtilisin family serine protease